MFQLAAFPMRPSASDGDRPMRRHNARATGKVQADEALGIACIGLGWCGSMESGVDGSHLPSNVGVQMGMVRSGQ